MATEWVDPPAEGPKMTDTAFTVDVDTLERSADTLRAMAEQVWKWMLVPLRAEARLGTQADGDGINESAAVFGRFEAAIEVASKHQAFFDSANAATMELIKSLRNTADATEKMAKKYRDAEEASRGSMQDILAIFESSTGATADAAPASAAPSSSAVASAGPTRLPLSVMEEKGKN